MVERKTVRLGTADFARFERLVEQAIKKTVPDLVKKEFESVGIIAADADDRVEVVKDMLFVRKIRQGAEAAEGLIGKRLVNGLLWLLGVLLTMGCGALLHLLYSGK